MDYKSSVTGMQKGHLRLFSCGAHLVHLITYPNCKIMGATWMSLVPGGFTLIWMEPTIELSTQKSRKKIIGKPRKKKEKRRKDLETWEAWKCRSGSWYGPQTLWVGWAHRVFQIPKVPPRDGPPTFTSRKQQFCTLAAPNPFASLSHIYRLQFLSYTP